MAKKGTGLTITLRPNGSWRAQIRKVGFPYDSREFLSHEEADAWGLGRLDEILKTRQLVDRRAAERITFGELIERYLIEVTAKRRSQSSREAETARLGRFKREERTICAYAIAYLKPEYFVEWRDRRLTEKVSRGSPYKPEAPPQGRTKRDGTPRANAAKPKPPPKPVSTVSPGTVKREMTLLKRILDFGVKKYKLAINPLADKEAVERPFVDDTRDVRLSPAQWQKLKDECKKSRNPWLASYVEIALETGARRGSLFKLRWDDINLETGAAKLRDVKNSRRPNEVRNVEIGLNRRARELLAALPRSIDGRVFPTTKGAISQAFERARVRADVAHFRLHDSRHELASRLVEEGWEMVDVMAQGDWRDAKSLKRYYGARGEHLSKKMDGGNKIK